MVAAIALTAASLTPAVSAEAKGPGGSGEETTLTNNLSYPVIWSGDGALVIPGVFGEPELTKPVNYTVPGTEPPEVIPVYPQATEGNTWQAGSELSLTPVEVNEIDWGDNLEAKSLTLGKPIRVETTLIKNLISPMLAFKMVSLEGEMREEVFATTGDTEESEQATIYSGCARLTIQRLLISREDPYLYLLKWDASTGEWTGEEVVSPAVFNGGVWQSSGEGEGYSAEVNGSGKVLYGYNWRTSGLTSGDYRITFSFDQACLNTFVTEDTKVVFSEEESAEPTVDASSGGVSGGGVPKVDAVNNLSYVDVQLGTPTYVPYVPPPAPTPETKTEQTTTTTSTTSTSTTQSREQTRTRAKVTVTLHLQRKRVKQHTRYRLYGSVTPPRHGQKLRIQIRTKSGWRTIRVLTLRQATKTRSSYSVTLKHPKPGTYRAMIASNERYLTGTSSKLRLRVHK